MNLLNQLDTPCLLLDKSILEQNIRRMQAKARQHQVRLRPHLKTAKSVDIAKLFAASGETPPITVSTLKEAEYFAAAGFRDILYAVSLEPGKFERLRKLLNQHVRVTVILDNHDVATELAGFASAHHVTMPVMIEVDVDGHRAGLKPDDGALGLLAQFLQRAECLEFAGLMTHAGGSYDCRDSEAVKVHAVQEKEGILFAANRCREAGVEVPVVSVGSTPTVVAASDLNGLDEIRPGVFVFFDLFQLQLGMCSFSDIALSVLCSVVTHKQGENSLIVDAGGLALSKDRSTQGTRHDYGYGLVADIDGHPLSPEVSITAVNQEHGIIQLPNELSVAQFPPGSRLRIYPNHACMTAAAYDGYVVLQPDKKAAPLYWGRCNGW